MPLNVTPQKTVPSASWLLVGAKSDEATKAEEAAHAKRKEEKGKAFRFWLKDGEKAQITFVDGDLVDGNHLQPPRYYEHNLYLNGTWGHTFVCPQSTNPGSGEKCPICESGDRPSLVSLFTIIDHREFSSKDGSKSYKDSVKLLVAPSQPFLLLREIALKVGGLAGSRWEVSRSGEKSSRIGSSFYPESKKTIEELRALYSYEDIDPKTGVKSTKTKFKALDYETEIIYRTSAQLLELGLGKPSAPSFAQAPVDVSSYAKEL